MAAGQPNFVLRHLFIWLHALNRTVEAAVAERRRDNAGLARHAGNMAELNAHHAGQLLQGLRKFIAEGPPRAAPLVLQADEQQMVAELVERHGRLLPLHRLATEAGAQANGCFCRRHSQQASDCMQPATRTWYLYANFCGS